jgi:hypothetical protein
MEAVQQVIAGLNYHIKKNKEAMFISLIACRSDFFLHNTAASKPKSMYF